jgi:hypothetical protein
VQLSRFECTSAVLAADRVKSWDIEEEAMRKAPGKVVCVVMVAVGGANCWEKGGGRGCDEGVLAPTTLYWQNACRSFFCVGGMASQGEIISKSGFALVK